MYRKGGGFGLSPHPNWEAGRGSSPYVRSEFTQRRQTAIASSQQDKASVEPQSLLPRFQPLGNECIEDKASPRAGGGSCLPRMHV